MLVECGDCGWRFELSVRNEYRHRSEGRKPRCETCRRPPLVMSDEEREQFLVWWLYSSGLELEELVEIAVGLVGDDASSRGSALAISQ